jgi:hypothetical protein
VRATPEQLFSDDSDDRPGLGAMQALMEAWEKEGIDAV